MARFETFDRDILVATADLSEEAISAELARVAKSELASAIASKEGSPIYERFVNGKSGASEESVDAPGPIVYVFSWWPEIITYALEYLRKRSPRQSGEFQNSWFVMVDNARVASWDEIPIDAAVTITNDRPYARKIEVGHMVMSVPHGVVEDGRVAVRRLYGAIFDVQKSFIMLPGGYVLKGHFRRGVRPDARRTLQKDTMAGGVMTYPALQLRMKV